MIARLAYLDHVGHSTVITELRAQSGAAVIIPPHNAKLIA
jgi:hypothetical protein